MNKLITLLVTVFLLSSCGDKPKPPPPKVMKFTIRGKTFKVKAELTDKAKYTAEDIKTRLAKKYAELDNK